MPTEPGPRRRASDRDPELAGYMLARNYAGPWIRLARLIGPAAPLTRSPRARLARWLARRELAWLVRHVENGTTPAEMWRRPDP